jgi:hypothetical protein
LFLFIVAGKLYPEQVVLSLPYDAQFRRTHLIDRIGVEEIAGKCRVSMNRIASTKSESTTYPQWDRH